MFNWTIQYWYKIRISHFTQHEMFACYSVICWTHFVFFSHKMKHVFLLLEYVCSLSTKQIIPFKKTSYHLQTFGAQNGTFDCLFAWNRVGAYMNLSTFGHHSSFFLFQMSKSIMSAKWLDKFQWNYDFNSQEPNYSIVLFISFQFSRQWNHFSLFR